MHWYTIEVSTETNQYGHSEFSAFCRQFAAVYERSDHPPLMALLAGEWEMPETKTPSVRLYISPGAVPYVLPLIHQYGCHPCVEPPGEPLILVVGFDRAKPVFCQSA